METISLSLALCEGKICRIYILIHKIINGRSTWPTMIMCKPIRFVEETCIFVSILQNISRWDIASHDKLPRQYNIWKRRLSDMSHDTARPCYVRMVSSSEETWRRHQMETFSALLALCVGNSSVTGEFPSQRPVTRSFDVFFDLRLNIRFSKQSRRRWFETPSRPLWHHCNYMQHPFPLAIDRSHVTYFRVFCCRL